MRRKVCVLLVCFVFLLVSFPTFAFSKVKHNIYMEQVLFGPRGYRGPNIDGYLAISKLDDACALAIDQYNGSYEQELLELKRYGVRHLPSSIKEINFSDGSDHRGKTHLGWDYNYPKTGKHKNANWPLRKKILLSTVNKVFDFGFFSGWFGIYDEKCKSFSALIYYVHILGDTIADKAEKTEHQQKKLDNLVLPLVVRQQSEAKPDIISELKKHIGILFEDQDHSGIDKKLDQLRKDAMADVFVVDGCYSERYYEYAEKLMDILIQDIPNLLKRESFFIKVFPPY